MPTPLHQPHPSGALRKRIERDQGRNGKRASLICPGMRSQLPLKLPRECIRACPKKSPHRQTHRWAFIKKAICQQTIGGKRGIRTLVTGRPVNRISSPAHSTTLPSFRKADAHPLLHLYCPRRLWSTGARCKLAIVARSHAAVQIGAMLFVHNWRRRPAIDANRKQRQNRLRKQRCFSSG